MDELEKSLEKLKGSKSGDASGEDTSPEPDKVPTGHELSGKGPVPPVPQPGLNEVDESVSESPCQWFTPEIKFCDKLKKYVHCEGKLSNCLVCK